MSLLTFIQVVRCKKEILLKLSVKPIKVSVQGLYETPVLRKAVESLQKDNKIVVTHDPISCNVYITRVN
jgi:hypothetical protein